MGIFGGSSAIFRVNREALKAGIGVQATLQGLIQACSRNERLLVTYVLGAMNGIGVMLKDFHSFGGRKRAMRALKLIQPYSGFRRFSETMPIPGFQVVKIPAGGQKVFLKAMESAYVEVQKALAQEMANGCVQWAKQVEGMRGSLQKEVNAKAITSTSKGIQDAISDISIIGQSGPLAPAAQSLGQAYDILGKIRSGVDGWAKSGDQRARMTLQDALVKVEGELGKAIRALE